MSGDHYALLQDATRVATTELATEREIVAALTDAWSQLKVDVEPTHHAPSDADFDVERELIDSLTEHWDALWKSAFGDIGRYDDLVELLMEINQSDERTRYDPGR